MSANDNPNAASRERSPSFGCREEVRKGSRKAGDERQRKAHWGEEVKLEGFQSKERRGEAEWLEEE